MTRQPTATPASYAFVLEGEGRVHFAPLGTPLGPAHHYTLHDFAIAQAFGEALSPELADLVDIAAAVYVADRLARRRPDHADRYHLHWTREIHLRVPLRQPAHWRNTPLGEHLSRLLLFLTEDVWRFEFVQRVVRPRRSETIRTLLKVDTIAPVTVGLFSGGLDSFAGACHELLEHSGGTLVLLSGNTNQRIGALQESLAKELSRKAQRLSRGEVRPISVKFGLRRRGGQYAEDEPSQRSRGFIYPVLAAVAAILADASAISVYEPGIGAISLPYTEAQLGSQSTRATDPRTLAMLSELIRLATGRVLTIKAPFLFQTKAEVVENISRFGMEYLARETVSCDGVSLRVKDHTHCGRCTSCLLRRQALDVAGLGNLDRQAGIYQHDIWARGIRFEKLHSLRAMSYQVSKLEWALQRPNPWAELSRMYPQLVEVAALVGQPTSPAEDRLVQLYRRYCDEWADFQTRLPGALAA